MITRWISAVRLSLLLSIPMLMALPLRAEPNEVPGIADFRRASTGQRDAARKDLVSLHRQSDALVVKVQHVAGIGSKRLPMPAGGWPRIVRVRLHDFPDVESFTAHATSASLDCMRIRPEGIPSRLACRFGEAEVDAIREAPAYFEITLPAKLSAEGGPIEIHWVDQWR